MKTQLNLRKAWFKVLIYFLVLWLATIIAGMIPLLNDLIFFFLVALTISWIFLYIERKPLTTLGFLPLVKKDYKDFFAGLGIGAVMLIITVVITLLLTKDSWIFNPHIDPIYVAIAFLACLWSAFVQEFVFRGYPFQTLLKDYGPWTAQIFIAIPFGLMHLNHNMSVSLMASAMLTTGLGSILFGLACLKTKKLFLPTGLHFGWNYAQQLIPRTTGGGNSGIIIIPGEQTAYPHLLIIGPYLLVVILAIACLTIKINRKSTS